MSTTEEVVELMNGLPEQLRAEVADFARFLTASRVRRPKQVKLRLSWAGGLQEFRDKYTALELQKKGLRRFGWVTTRVHDALTR
jgi:hypothetical protein